MAELRFETKKITPQEAQELLERNNQNRRLRQSTVSYYVDMMRRNQWKGKNGETVKIAEDGDLLDGQHRLKAVTIVGRPQWFTFAYNVDKRDYTTIDIGLKRTGGDMLHAHGVENANVIAGMVRKYLLFKQGKGYATMGGQQGRAITNEDITLEYDTHPDYWQNLTKRVNTWYVMFYKAMYPSDLGGFYSLFFDINKDDADRFFERLCTGTELKESSPIKALRDKFIQANSGGTEKIKTIERSALIIKAWNIFRKHGAVPKVGLTWKADKEEFPKPI